MTRLTPCSALRMWQVCALTVVVVLGATACQTHAPTAREEVEPGTRLASHPMVEPGELVSLTGVWGADSWDDTSARGVAFSSSGEQFAVGGDSLTVLETQTRKVVAEIPGHSHGSVSVDFSPDGTLLASGGAIDGTAKIWEVETGRKIADVSVHQREGYGSGLVHVAFSPDGSRVLAGCDDQTVMEFDAETGRRLWKSVLAEEAAGDVRVAYSEEGALAAAASGVAGTLVVWEAESGKKSWQRSDQNVGDVAFRADDETLAAAGEEGTVLVYDVDDGTLRKEIGKGDGVHPGGTKCVEVLGDSKRVLTGGAYPTIWNLSTGARTPLLGHEETALDVAVSNDARYAASVGDGVRLWDLEREAELQLPVHDGAVIAVEPLGEGDEIFSISSVGQAFVWEGRAGGVSRRLGLPRAQATGAVAADGSRAILVRASRRRVPDEDGIGVYEIDPRTASRVGELDGWSVSARSVGLSADGRFAVQSRGSSCWTYDTDQEQMVAADYECGPVNDLAVLNDGRVFVATGAVHSPPHHASSAYGGGTGLWRGVDGTKVWSKSGAVTTAVAASSNGAEVLAGDLDGRLSLRDGRTGELRWEKAPRDFEEPPPGTADPGVVTAVGITPDERYAVALDRAGIRLWEIESGRHVDTVGLEGGTSLGFAEDGREMFVGTAEGMIFRFSLPERRRAR